MDLSQLTKEEKDLLARAYDGENVDLSKVPPDRKALLAQAWDEFGQDAAPKPKETPPVKNGFLANKENAPLDPGTYEMVKPVLESVLKPVGKAADYLGGITRTAVVAPFTDKVNIGDVAKALIGKAQTPSQLWETAGVPELGKMSDLFPDMYAEKGTTYSPNDGNSLLTKLRPEKGGALDLTGRGVLANVSNAFTDPLSHLTLGNTGTAGRVAEDVGNQIYESGLKKADRALELVGKGKKGFSETASRLGMKGSAEDIEGQAVDWIQKLEKRKQEILQEAAKRGGTVDMEQVLSPVIEDAKKIQNTANLAPIKQQAGKFEGMMQQLVDETRPIPEKVIHPEPVQGDMFRPNELSQPTQVKQLSVNVDEPLTGTMTGSKQLELPKQGDLFSEGAMQSTPNAPVGPYEEMLTQGKIAPGQTEMFTPGSMTQPLKPEIIPGRPPTSVVDASRLKSQMWGQIGDDGFKTLANDSMGRKLLKRSGQRTAAAERLAVKNATPELYDEFRQLMKDQGNLLSSRKVLQNEASKEIAKNALTSVDGILAVANPAVATSKKFADILQLTSVKTHGGDALRKAGQALQRNQGSRGMFLIKEALRQKGIDENDPVYGPMLQQLPNE